MTTTFTRTTLLLLSVIVLIFAASIGNAQTTTSSPAQTEVAKVTAASSTSNSPANVPVFKDYRGVAIGMSADEVEAKLKNLKEAGSGQDFFVFSERESAQIYYDENKKVVAISIDYFGDNGSAPSPVSVLGIELEPKPDGSMYRLNRYVDAGYWVSYNRTAGEKPIVTITMQKF
jgi:hypothetical protein